ncbi:hypothetical protein LNKW23_19770 [Paralimibaculum aggregatum]|uniref:Uncharacterized protein n=1 Tax=Paralimibaculum aggregatum TaxID=3036245 RepID=A0ABQ6LKK1_9RHOB|nr:hypothetical protein [Limibaculum sp. NKW23]GMG82764.1 hypothetical protein LNKW23_19770 [Limibaculum sp. NKW23]
MTTQSGEADLPAPQDLRNVPEGREIKSFHLALDKTKRFVSFKTLTADGRSEVLLLSAKIALYIRDQFREKLRARKGLEAVPNDESFFSSIPRHDQADWDTASPHVGVPIGVHVETGRGGCILAFPLDKEGKTVPYGLSALHAAYFMHAINDVEANEDFGKDPAPTAQGTETLQ